MSRLYLSIFLSTYSDKRASNATSLNNFKWNRDINGIDATNPASRAFVVDATSSLTLFDDAEAKKLVYIESDQEVELTINGETALTLKPVIINDSKFPGIFLQTSDITSIAVNNAGAEDANIFLITVE
jgi:hypothetical protein